MADLVTHLERHGYVERVPDADDRRLKLADVRRPKPAPPVVTPSGRING